MGLSQVAVALLVVAALCGAMTLPPRLRPGDTVAFVSPCSPICDLVTTDCPDGFKASVTAQFASLGLNVVWGKNAFSKDHYLAGDDEERASDLADAFASPNVRAIIATRGGEGSARMLHLLNFSAFAPKIIVGYSDMTAVLNSVHQSSGFVTFHGPMGISNWSLTSNGLYFKQVLMDGAPVIWTTPTAANPYTIRPGVAKGKLIGGNLSILTNILASRYAPLSAFVGAILFIEDVDEEPYKIDRYITQLALYGVLDVVAGVMFGQCTNCVAPQPTFSISEILNHHLAHRPIPSFAGAFFGHIDDQWTLPIGADAVMDASAHSISFGVVVQ